MTLPTTERLLWHCATAATVPQQHSATAQCHMTPTTEAAVALCCCGTVEFISLTAELESAAIDSLTTETNFRFSESFGYLWHAVL